MLANYQFHIPEKNRYVVKFRNLLHINTRLNIFSEFKISSIKYFGYVPCKRIELGY